jgi:hypothetical protein
VEHVVTVEVFEGVDQWEGGSWAVHIAQRLAGRRHRSGRRSYSSVEISPQCVNFIKAMPCSCALRMCKSAITPEFEATRTRARLANQLWSTKFDDDERTAG